MKDIDYNERERSDRLKSYHRESRGIVCKAYVERSLLVLARACSSVPEEIGRRGKVLSHNFSGLITLVLSSLSCRPDIAF